MSERYLSKHSRLHLIFIMFLCNQTEKITYGWIIIINDKSTLIVTFFIKFTLDYDAYCLMQCSEICNFPLELERIELF